MKIVCLAKQIPDPAHIRFDPKARTLLPLVDAFQGRV